jgi:hypothetical protein
MRVPFLVLIMATGLCACQNATAVPGVFDPVAPVPPREAIEWVDAWSQPSQKNNLPRVLLIGDSISKGYHGAVTGQLAGKSYVDRMSSSYSIGDPILLDLILAQVRNRKFRVIHLNNGLHGIAYSIDAYEKGMRLLITEIQKANPSATLVLATSTQVLPGYGGISRKAVDERNAVVAKLAKEFKLQVDDLHAVTIEHPEFYLGDKIHYNGKGYAALGKQIAENLSPLLEAK